GLLWAGERIREDVPDAFRYGWSLTAAWIKALVVMVGALLVGLFLRAVVIGIADAADSASSVEVDRPDLPRHTGIVAAVTQPVRAYLFEHTSGLPVSGATAYGLWLVAGASFLGWAWLFRALGARLGWLAYGAATVVMVWQGSPAGGRPVAAGIAVLAWCALSVPALRGLRFLTFSSHSTHHSNPEIKVEPRIEVQVAPPVVEMVEVTAVVKREGDWG
ncbi:hypothetical protein, partial [Streptomyces sp. NRRL S-495]|uniref:hypothetical protein n=1 Tax=Streptomyces sp. NRRL S-495 TaxID=1609133 RepID=UPI000698DA27